jgi:predicted O-linked N-acetylglucosamine transferase (SPINDLY family)
MNAASEVADWIARGRTHQHEGRPVDALLCFRRASRADPRAPDPHFVLGEVLWQLGRLPEAVGAWQEAARIDPTYLAPWQAIAEARLATGDEAGAREAAERVLALAPGNTRARLILGIVRLGSEPAAADEIGRALDDEPALAGVPTLAGPLALALDRAPASEGRSRLLARLARAPDALVAAPLLLAALALEHAANEGSVDSAAAAAALVAMLRTRHAGHVDLEAMRRVGVASAKVDAAAASDFAARYAEWSGASLAAAAPTGWPRRVAGARTRVAVLVPASDIDSDAVRALMRLPREDFAITLAVLGVPPKALPKEATGIVLPVPHDAAAAKAIAAQDPDVLVDLAGMRAPIGSLLAQRPARAVWTLSTLRVPHAAPLADRRFGDVDSLAAALVARHRARDAGQDCPLEGAALAALWTDAVRAHQAGDRAAALAGYAKVLELQPGFAPAHYLSGVALRDNASPDARAAFAAAIATAPGYVEARLAAANAATAAGDAAAAVALCEEGLAAMPFDAGLLRALGRAHLARRDGSAAAAAFARALNTDMTDGETHYNLGVALQMQREFTEAARAYQRALLFRPDFVGAHFNLGALFQEQRMTDAAIAAYGEVLAADPANVAAFKNLGEVLLAAGRIDAFLANFRRFEERCPEALPLAVQALVACQHQGDFAKLDRYLEGLRHERFVPQSEAEQIDALEELLYLLLYFDVEPPLLLHLAETYDAAARRAYGEPLPAPVDRRPGRLRVGYLSGDLRNHVMGKMAWAAVERHDRRRFELFFYSLSEADDDWTARFRGLADHFRVVARESVDDTARAIAADDLDVLVDLSTHTQGARPGVLARKPARVQITHVASAGTVGLRTIDFKLTDHYADLPANQAFLLETLLPMDGCVYPYRRVATAATHPFRRASLAIEADAVLIGAFVSPLKLSRRCLALWRDVLARVPKAKLAFSPVNPALRASFERLVAAAGIGSDRILFVPQGRDDAENQARYALIDFVLDPMPYGGANGTLEALDMRVPVVALVGRRHAERTSYSILVNLGVTATIAESGSEYVAIAERLATDPAFMREVRAAIDAGLRQSTLTDALAHTRSLERAYVAALAAKAPEALAMAQEANGG